MPKKKTGPKTAQQVLCTIVELRDTGGGQTRERVLAATGLLRAGLVDTPAGPKLYLDLICDARKCVRLEVPSDRAAEVLARWKVALNAQD